MAQAPSELIYSTQATGYEPGRAYSNPRFFTTPREGVTRVIVIGDWPKVVSAYKAVGVEVLQVSGAYELPALLAGHAPAEPPPTPEDKATREGKAFVSALPPDERGAVEIPEGWRDLSWPALRSLASKVSDVPVLNKAIAAEAIAAELARREAAAQPAEAE